jgi:predicted ArsR family transcriptional regulator
MATTQSVPDLSDTHQKTRAVALAVSECDGRASTSDIGDHVTFGAPLVGYHADRLVEAGVLVDTGDRVDVGGPIEARVFELTDEGTTAVSRYRGHANGMTTEARIESLEATVARLEAELETEREARERLAEFVKEGGLEERIKAALEN